MRRFVCIHFLTIFIFSVVIMSAAYQTVKVCRAGFTNAKGFDYMFTGSKGEINQKFDGNPVIQRFNKISLSIFDQNRNFSGVGTIL